MGNGSRQANFEAGAPLFTPGKLDLASVLHSQIFRDPQAEAGTHILLGGEERFEYLLKILLWDARAIVGESDHGIVPVSGYMDAQLSIMGSRVDGVDQQI